MATEESIKKDMTTPPPNTPISNMYYIGFYNEEKLIAVMDLIDGYPEQKNMII